MPTKTVRKAVIYEEDLAKSTGSGSATASRGTSTGGTQTLTKLGAGSAWFFNNVNNILFVDGVKYASAQAAHDALPAAGGTIKVPRGSTPFGAANTTPLIISKPVRVEFDDDVFTYAGTAQAISVASVNAVTIEGSGNANGQPAGATAASGTQIVVTNTAANGADINVAPGIVMRNLTFVGPNSGTGKGLIITANSGYFENVQARAFGGDGVEIDGTRGNSNRLILMNVVSVSNGGWGFDVFGTNANLLILATDGRSNTLGNYQIATQANVFLGTHSAASGTATGYTFVSGAQWNWGNLYSEIGDETTAVALAAGANNNDLFLSSQTVFTNSGTNNTIRTNRTMASGSSVGTPSYSFVGSTNMGFYDAGGAIGISVSGAAQALLTTAGMRMGSGEVYAFSSNADPTAAGNDTGISRAAAGEIAMGTGAAASEVAVVRLKRVRASGGTGLVAGDFALSAGWGTTASIGSIRGTDQFHEFTITSAGTGQGASPTVTLTYKDGTWTTAPVVRVNRQEFANQATVPFTVTTQSATQYVLTFNGTPVAAETYRVCVFVGGI